MKKNELTPDDPRLTAYVLGELDEAERAELERELADSDESRQLVDEFRAVAEQLRDELEGEPCPALSGEQRERIAASASEPAGAGSPAPQNITSLRRRWIAAIGFTGLAACALVAASLAIRHLQDMPAGDDGASDFDLARTPAAAQPAAASSERSGETAYKADAGLPSSGVEGFAADGAVQELDELHKLRVGEAGGGGAMRDAEREALTVTLAARSPQRGEELTRLNETVDGLRRQQSEAEVDMPLGAVDRQERTVESLRSLEKAVAEGRDAAAAASDGDQYAGGRSFGVDLEESVTEAARKPATAVTEAAPEPSSRGGALVRRAAPPAPLGPSPTGTAAKRPAAAAGEPTPDDSLAAGLEPEGRARGAETRRFRATVDEAEAAREDGAVALGEDGRRLGELGDADKELEQQRKRGLFTPTEPEVRLLTPPVDTSRETYDFVEDNPFVAVADDPRSTFSIDVDKASYANVRRYLQGGARPPRGAVRIEELVNYFSYDYVAPEGEHPFSVNLEVAECPWQGAHRLVRVGLKGKEFKPEERPAGNFVFLIDSSGSMRPENKLPLLKTSMRLLVEKLDARDRVAIVIYAGTAGLVLPATPGDRKEDLHYALDRIQAQSGTHASAGIQLAYDIAAQNFIPGGVNRVILATDGDFNIGITDDDELVSFVKEKAKGGVFLSVLGFGTGNLMDAKMEKIADHGNGNYFYIDSPAEGRKVLVEELAGTLVTIAKDVKLQVEFNPAEVAAYRLIGYENRKLAHTDFNDDTKDAGEIGSGHTVTALYEVVPVGAATDGEGASPVLKKLDPLKYQKEPAAERALSDAAKSGELLTVKLRYKQPDGDTSALIETAVVDEGLKYAQASRDFKFAASVAAFGMILRDSPHKGNATLRGVVELADESKGDDPQGHRGQFIELAKKAMPLVEPDPSRAAGAVSEPAARPATPPPAAPLPPATPVDDDGDN